MCGIVGFTGAIDATKLDMMLDLISHRGPDGEGKLKKAGVSLGMRRLAIIDPEGGKQPIWNEDGTIAIFFNGEIYNYQELWAEIVQKGHKFATDHSDTETIIHAYEEWGADCVKKLRGMFAFAIWDSQKHKLFIARDRIGIKPLYYTLKDGQLIFASELKAITKVWFEKAEPNPAAVYRFLRYRLHDNDEQTFFKDIVRLLPGHYMEIDLSANDHTPVITKYWNPEVSSQFSGEKSDKEYASRFREKFLEAVKLHLISDVPLGVCLSGGLDSSGIAGSAAKLRRSGSDTHTDGLLTFSAVFPGQSIDETSYIDEVVKFTNATKFTVSPTVDKFWDEITEWIYYQEEPTISSAPYAYYNVYRLASEHVKVTLSGNGGDELLAGYIPYFQAYISSAQDQGKAYELMRELFRGADLYFPYFWNQLKSKLKGGQLTVGELLGSDFTKAYEQDQRLNFSNLRNLNERLLQDVTYSSIPNLTRYDDKNSMAFSIESRPPLLDHELVEFILKLPIDQKIKYGWNRYVYRNAMQGLMPEKNRWRRSKIGFTNPELSWLKASAHKYREIFASESFKSRNFWDAEKVSDAFEKVLAGKAGDILMFWRIINVELWLRAYCD